MSTDHEVVETGRYSDCTDRTQAPERSAATEVSAHIKRTFTYHAPFGDQPQRYAELHQLYHDTAVRVAELCPPSSELTLALRDLEMSRMRANQSIAVNETGLPPMRTR